MDILSTSHSTAPCLLHRSACYCRHSLWQVVKTSTDDMGVLCFLSHKYHSRPGGNSVLDKVLILSIMMIPVYAEPQLEHGFADPVSALLRLLNY